MANQINIKCVNFWNPLEFPFVWFEPFISIILFIISVSCPNISQCFSFAYFKFPTFLPIKLFYTHLWCFYHLVWEAYRIWVRNFWHLFMWSQKWSCSWQHKGFGSKWKFFRLLTFISFGCFQYRELNFWWYFSFQSKYIRWERFPRIKGHARVNILWKTAEYIFFIWLSWMRCLTFSWFFKFLQVPEGFQEIEFYLQSRESYYVTILRQFIIFLLIKLIIPESRSK